MGKVCLKGGTGDFEVLQGVTACLKINSHSSKTIHQRGVKVYLLFSERLLSALSIMFQIGSIGIPSNSFSGVLSKIQTVQLQFIDN